MTLAATWLPHLVAWWLNIYSFAWSSTGRKPAGLFTVTAINLLAVAVAFSHAMRGVARLYRRLVPQESSRMVEFVIVSYYATMVATSLMWPVLLMSDELPHAVVCCDRMVWVIGALFYIPLCFALLDRPHRQS